MVVKHKVYSPEFMLQAVEMVNEQKFSVAEAARCLGMRENRLHEWKKADLPQGKCTGC